MGLAAERCLFQGAGMPVPKFVVAYRCRRSLGQHEGRRVLLQLEGRAHFRRYLTS